MATETNPAIELLVTQIVELERKANAFRTSVNILCEKDGLPPLYPEGGGGGGVREGTDKRAADTASTPAQIRHDTFYGKRQQTAVRELLSIRKSSGLGPAKPIEILDGIKAGGYQVEAKTDDIALVGLRAMLRKRPAVFHKLPNGSWGLAEWYPNAKRAKASGTDAVQSVSVGDEDENETAAPTRDDEAAA